MAEHTYKHIELTGSSTKSSDEAIRNAIKKANETVRNMRWFVVTENRGYIENGEVAYWQVTVKVGFTLDE